MDTIIDILRNRNRYSFRKKGNYSLYFIIEDGTSRNFSLDVVIAGQDIRVNITGLIIGWRHEKINLSIRLNHKASGSRSDMDIRSLMFGKAGFDFSGLIRIEKEASASKAYMLNRNLLISEEAGIRCKPCLEILTDDVRCTHGVASAGIDGNELFYLMSRGLTYNQSVRIIVEGFARGLLGKIGNRETEKHLERIAGRRFNKLFAKEAHL